jgi:hypothetical protein
MSVGNTQQQKLFGMVHAYQTGKLSENSVDSRIIKLARHISPDMAKKYALAERTDLKQLFHSVEYIVDTLHSIVENNQADYVKGTLIDKYTASLLLTVFNKLNEQNQQQFVKRSLNEMVALSYTILTS